MKSYQDMKIGESASIEHKRGFYQVSTTITKQNGIQMEIKITFSGKASLVDKFRDECKCKSGLAELTHVYYIALHPCPQGDAFFQHGSFKGINHQLSVHIPKLLIDKLISIDKYDTLRLVFGIGCELICCEDNA